jgi:hypothetical protein
MPASRDIFILHTQNLRVELDDKLETRQDRSRAIDYHRHLENLTTLDIRELGPAIKLAGFDVHVPLTSYQVRKHATRVAVGTPGPG